MIENDTPYQIDELIELARKPLRVDQAISNIKGQEQEESAHKKSSISFNILSSAVHKKNDMVENIGIINVTIDNLMTIQFVKLERIIGSKTIIPVFKDCVIEFVNPYGEEMKYALTNLINKELFVDE